MAKIYTWRFNVRSYELGAASQVQPHTFLNYLEEGAVEASASNGYTFDWYRTNQRLWVVKNILIRYYEPAFYNEELELQTWITDSKRKTSSYREYSLRRQRDNMPIVHAIANWVYMDATTMQPQRIPAQFFDAFEPAPNLTGLDTALTDPIQIQDPVIYTDERRVQHYEVDANGHTNNSVYVAWCEETFRNALRAAGWPPERYTNGEVNIQPVSHEIDYFRSTFEHEPVWLNTRLVEVGRDRAAWHTEIRHGVTNELIAKDIAIRAFTDAKGPRSIPDTMQLALMKHARP